ncbi:MAG: hypothetical protein JSV33_12550 [bacterium]|nr:MAG: hypothetical protein JSV33_12550 [bacterium]
MRALLRDSALVAISIYIMLPFFGCSSTTDCSGDCEPDIITERQYEEAELIALFLSGEITAPETLTVHILNDLRAIRYRYGNRHVPILTVPFVPPAPPSCFYITFDDTTTQKIEGGTYHAWDSLNATYGLNEVRPVFGGDFNLYFDGRLNPWRLIEFYETLPGFVTAHVCPRIGDSPNIYPHRTLDCFYYLFRDAWGDCLSGCIFSEFWFYKVEEYVPSFIGHWDPQEDPEEPEWWPEWYPDWWL